MPVSPLKILTVAAFAAAGSSGQWSVVGGQFAPPAVAGAAFAAAAETKTEVYAHPVSRHYKPPREPEVRAHLERWRDLKFGVLISWGIYNELDNGIGSWVICAEKNQPWISRPKNIPYEQYKRDYWLLKDKFAPTKFDPEKWAEVFKDAGVKYMIFTTKHHDGFAMWDTKQTDFSIAHGAFKNDPRRDLAKGIFSTFQKHKFVTGVYFSKPDWHSPYFWKPDAPTPNRNVNYSIPKEPERWQKFKDYTYAQIEELTGGNYGKIDILWLDGGWVRPRVQDINIAHVAKIARSHNPEMIVVDRAVPSEFENYQTPEGHVLKGPQSSPWETCTTLGRGWEHVNNPKNNSAHWLVHTLVDIVAKNGNLLLGLGPDKYGELDPTAVATLRKTGAWLRANGEAIYGTRAARHYKDGSVWFTQAKNAANVYAIACFPEG
ncbi:MAG: alpha-L-fucosidase, partial [Puniceicoccales bacterium]|nr:alpha-L-fucosidase [Puniceicoccales bacterium]